MFRNQEEGNMSTQHAFKRIRGRQLAVLMGAALVGAAGFGIASTASASEP